MSVYKHRLYVVLDDTQQSLPFSFLSLFTSCSCISFLHTHSCSCTVREETEGQGIKKRRGLKEGERERAKETIMLVTSDLLVLYQ